MLTPASAAPRRAAINESVACAELADEVVLLNVETGIYFGLDAVGAAIWRLLTEGNSQEEVFDRMLAEYDVDPADLRADLAAFLDALDAKGLVRMVAD